MTPDRDKDELVRDYHLTFETPHGQRVLQNISNLCGGHVNKDLFDEDSARRTDYNLGMNRVYRHMKSHIDAEIGKPEPEDCIIDEPEQKGL